MARPVAEPQATRSEQARLLRAAGIGRRFALACSLSATTIAMAREAIRKRHPEWTEREVLYEFVRVHYGSKLADAVRAYELRR